MKATWWKATWWKATDTGWIRHPRNGWRCEVAKPQRSKIKRPAASWYDWTVRGPGVHRHGTERTEQAAKDAADKAAE